jgi:protein-S-isoprenylcysteine O-methyltransferase Ste14
MYDIPWIIVVIGWTIMFVSYSVTKLKTHRCGGGIYTMEVPLAHKQKWPLRAMILLYLVLAFLFCVNFNFAELTFFYKEFSDFFIFHGTIIFIIAFALYVDARLTISSNCSWSGKFKCDRHKLIQSGPYKRVRHPQPLAYFLAFIATSFITHDAKVFLFALCLVPMYYAKSMIDEQYLLFIFPEYEDYMKKTGRFFLK